MQAEEIEKNFILQFDKNNSYWFTEMQFADGRTMFGQFLPSDQNHQLNSKNQWVFYFDEIRLIIDGNDITAFQNVYSPANKTASKQYEQA